MATRMKECMVARATYFVVLLTAALSAAVQDVVEISWRCDAAYVSGTVIYHTINVIIIIIVVVIIVIGVVIVVINNIRIFIIFIIFIIIIITTFFSHTSTEPLGL